ncbi:hypothetical protein L1049_023524 [Liquidambar formosana]|uniref:WLM domain-containing protein n=1 Tax=Liquidambar formosana TaxID=63359 RepID=A0AAP0RU76_LIQFO
MTGISVTWRGKKFNVEMSSGATLKEFGYELLKLTSVKADTMRLIVPQSSNKSSKLLNPFSDEHSHLSLQETSILEGKSIRMMGASEDEIDEIIKNSKADLRIVGFDEEEKRMRQRVMDRPHTSLKLPQGTYVFCDFLTLQIPGIELYPPPSEALKRMHMLAADPGIVAIMNKVLLDAIWRVGIMTEMAPEGYVGVSPECILGFNKNHGEEISLRLRTDDLKGFRKYESIKKTLLHELAHMVYSEHDANFYALDKQLNQEAASLDWTRSRSHTLSGVRHLEQYEEEYYVGDSSNIPQKLGGKTLDQLASARATSVAAAYQRLANASTNSLGVSEVHAEPDPDDSSFNLHAEPDSEGQAKLNFGSLNRSQWKSDHELDPDDWSGNQNKFEPDPDDSEGGDAMEFQPYSESYGIGIMSKPNFDDSELTQIVSPLTTIGKLASTRTSEEPDPDDSEISLKHGVVTEPGSDHSGVMGTLDSGSQPRETTDEPDPDDSQAQQNNLEHGNIVRTNEDEPDPDDSQSSGAEHAEPDPDDNLVRPPLGISRMQTDEPDPDDQESQRVVHVEPDPDDNLDRHPLGFSRMHTDEPDPDDQELQRIQDPVTVVCSRLQKAIDMLRSEVNPTEATTVLQTLFKIIRNVIEHPDDMKFKRLRKANPVFQRNVASYKAALEVLFLIGFNEDVVLDEIGRAETYLVLKRNDPGLLWLAKSSLETCIAY